MALEKDGENLKWLAGQSLFHPGLAQFPRLKVNFEESKTD
jgi:hypothetical protein